MSNITYLQTIVRQFSLERLSITKPIPGLTLKECSSSDDLVYGSATSIILVAGSPFKLLFKAHFKYGQMRTLLSQINKRSYEDNSDAVVTDHMREYCNLIAGGIKSCFSNIDLPCGISLPLVISGFDEVLYKSNHKPYVQMDIWTLDWEQGSVVCSSAIEVFDAEKMQSFDLQATNTQTADDDDAFL